MKRWVTGSLLVATIFMASCAGPMRAEDQKESQMAEPALIKAAQQAERRAAQAYQAGDVALAADGFEAALQVYDSLAQAERAARARLSLARTLDDIGQTQAALMHTRAALAVTTLDASTRITAYGRLAALLLPVDAAQAAVHLAQAEQLCTTACAQALALVTLRARAELAQGQAPAAVQSASRALHMASTTANLPEQANALRARALAQQLLGQHARVIADAHAALALDQQLGQTRRILQDLHLLTQAYRASSQTKEAQHFEMLAQRAQAALGAAQ